MSKENKTNLICGQLFNQMTAAGCHTYKEVGNALGIYIKAVGGDSALKDITDSLNKHKGPLS